MIQVVICPMFRSLRSDILSFDGEIYRVVELCFLGVKYCKSNANAGC